MSANSLFYRNRAEAAHRDAAEATLANVRERHLRAAAAWEKMAERGERTESGRAAFDAHKAAVRAEAAAAEADEPSAATAQAPGNDQPD